MFTCYLDHLLARVRGLRHVCISMSCTVAYSWTVHVAWPAVHTDIACLMYHFNINRIGALRRIHT